MIWLVMKLSICFAETSSLQAQWETDVPGPASQLPCDCAPLETLNSGALMSFVDQRAQGMQSGLRSASPTWRQWQGHTPQLHGAHLTSRSRPAATVTMSPVSLLMVNMFWDGLCGVWVTIRYRTIPLAVVLSSASLAVTVIT